MGSIKQVLKEIKREMIRAIKLKFLTLLQGFQDRLNSSNESLVSSMGLESNSNCGDPNCLSCNSHICKPPLVSDLVIGDIWICPECDTIFEKLAYEDLANWDEAPDFLKERMLQNGTGWAWQGITTNGIPG